MALVSVISDPRGSPGLVVKSGDMRLDNRVREKDGGGERN